MLRFLLIESGISFKTCISCLSNVVLSLETLDRADYGSERFEEFRMKLDEYQQATGINDTLEIKYGQRLFKMVSSLNTTGVEYFDVSKLNRTSLT